MKYAVIGAGAMGLRYGIHLKKYAGKEVDFIDTWEPNVEKIREQGGVYVARDHENRHLEPIDVYYPEEYTGDPDCWVVFVKQMQLDGFLERCAPLFKDHQICFTAMNGMGHYEKLLKHFSPERLFGGTAVIATVLPGPGDVDFMGALGKEYMHVCEYDNKRTPVGEQLFADLAAAKLGPEWSPDIMSMSMAKVMLNSVCNTLCTMFEIQMGPIGADPHMRHVCEQLVGEGFDVCELAGIDLGITREQEVDAIMQSFIDLKYHYPSMFQDMFKGRPTEVDYINGYIVKLGRQHGYEAVRHELLCSEVHFAETAHRVHEEMAAAEK